MQKVNFQVETDKILERVKLKETKPKLLLHSCCGPCSSYVLSCLTEFFEIDVYYFNPNIYPLSEYQKRLDTQKRLIEAIPKLNKIALFGAPYNHGEFLNIAGGHEKEPEGGARCEKCFYLRLKAAAEKAKEVGADYFGTTLTVSPHKNAQTINKIGAELEKIYGVKFLYSDFKKRNGYKLSVELSKRYALYRQEYCGCEFSQNFEKQ